MYATLYNHYTVLGAKIKVTAWSETNNTTYGSVVGIKLDDNGGINNNIQNILEYGKRAGTHYKFLRVTADASHSKTVITGKFSSRKFFGIKDPEDNETVGAAIGSSPTDRAFFNIFWGHIDGSTVLDTIRCIVEIEYIVKFGEPMEVNGS